MSKYECPSCGNDRFHEVGSVQTTTDVILKAVRVPLTEDERNELERLEIEFEAAGGRGVELADRIDALRAGTVKPTFVDYDYEASETIWDASSGYFIECSQCLAEVEAEGYESRQPEDEALAAIHKLLDGREWSADELPQIAEILGRAGKRVRAPGEADGPCED